MRDKARRPDVGAVGAILLYPSAADENTVTTQQPVVQHAGVILGIGAAEHFMKNEIYFDPYQGRSISMAVSRTSSREALVRSPQRAS